MYPRVRSAPRLRPLSSSVEHASRHHSEESTNYPETTLHSGMEPPSTFISPPPSPRSLPQPVLLSSLPIILSTQSDSSSPSPVGGYPTLTIALPQSTVLSPKIVCVFFCHDSFQIPSSSLQSSLLPTPSDAAVASGKLQTQVPTVTPTVTNGTHVGTIVGSVLGGLVVILLGVAVCYCL